VDLQFTGASSYDQNLCTWTPHLTSLTAADSMFAGTNCPRKNTPDPDNLVGSTMCASCGDFFVPSPTLSPIPLTQGFAGTTAFTTTLELITAVDAYMVDSSSSSDVATTYGFPIGNWDVSQITNFDDVFSAKRNPDMLLFNADLSNWDVSAATSMHAMFEATVSFTDNIAQGLSQWDVSQVFDMSNMFDSSGFAGSISQWNVENVRDFSFFAEFAVRFDSDLSLWNVANAENMGWMFRGAKSFTSDVSNWNVAKVADFTNMYECACSFGRVPPDKIGRLFARTSQTLHWPFYSTRFLRILLQVCRSVAIFSKLVCVGSSGSG
jgi:surface protein